LRTETQAVNQFVVLKNLQPRNPITDSLQRQERVIAFDEKNFNPNDLSRLWGMTNIRLFDGRWWVVAKSK
jgi:hypothetical protein